MKTYKGKYAPVYEALKNGEYGEVGEVQSRGSSIKVGNMSIVMTERKMKPTPHTVITDVWIDGNVKLMTRINELLSCFEIPLRLETVEGQWRVKNLYSGLYWVYDHAEHGGGDWIKLNVIYAATNHKGYLESQAQFTKVKTKGLYELASV